LVWRQPDGRRLVRLLGTTDPLGPRGGPRQADDGPGGARSASLTAWRPGCPVVHLCPMFPLQAPEA